jgi:hypothetical protein
MKKNELALHVIENSQNGKLKGKHDYNVITTYQQVGPTCPITCAFHPDHPYVVGIKPCYTLKGKTRFLVGHKAFELANYSKEEAEYIKNQFSLLLTKHKVGLRRVDGIRISTAGDLLNPNTKRPWVELLEVLKWLYIECEQLKIPVFGFTACWRFPELAWFKDKLQASVQDRDSLYLAKQMGWSTAYAVDKDDLYDEMQWLKQQGYKDPACPEQTGKTDCCLNCGLCATGDWEPHPLIKEYMKYRNEKQSHQPMAIVLIQH